MDTAFLPLLFRMKYINRWGLMHTTQPESLSLHSLECAFLAHFLATLGNTYLGRKHNADRVAVLAMYHDATEILTGDLPTPVKYFNDDINNAYKDIERAAAEKLLDGLPEELREVYAEYVNACDESDALLVKAADRLCAYIKCINETEAGNKEFIPPLAACREKVMATAEGCPELQYFLSRYINAFKLSLDELHGTL